MPRLQDKFDKPLFQAWLQMHIAVAALEMAEKNINEAIMQYRAGESIPKDIEIVQAGIKVARRQIENDTSRCKHLLEK